ncbi:hypothetical protein [Billgrantia aerodenitrificans]|uniref:Ribbon-helix-helix protein CopG domain-containing protein n=1 Tax=Billgrantia aerodenitrificans TaxID=2733483 RepID=A0ABS9AQI9_9GAMM|nr:hypothetical protein [Halomonas aerodenitrificans]MCE8024103.1 hypothetical protein [Halomonas aerodenitrificans]
MRPTWLTWLNPDDHGQLAWAGQYLARKGYPGVLPINGYPLDGVAFIEAMARYEQDRAFRYWVDKMRAAWRQKQYRTRNGQQVAFQLPGQVRKELARLAKARGLSRVETLRQVISEAAGQHDQEREAAKKTRKECQELKAKHEEMTGLYRRTINDLLESLAEELHERYRLQALLGDLTDESLDDEMIGKYTALIDMRKKEVKTALPELKLMRLGLPRFEQRLQTLANKLHPEG